MKKQFIVKKEFYGWLLFDIRDKKITKINDDDVERLESDGGIIRKIINPLIYGALSSPNKIFIDLTNHCNLSCKHCLSTSSKKNKIHIPFNKIKEIIDECHELGVFLFKLGGGEPFLRSDIWQICELISEKNIGITASTNGTVVSKKMVEGIKKYRIKLSISIDGDQEHHDFIRGKGIYEKTLNGIETLMDNDICPTLQFTLMNNNFKQTDHVLALSNELGLKLKIRRVKPIGRAKENKLVSTEQQGNYLRFLDKINEHPDIDLEDIQRLDYSSKSDIILGPTDCGAGTRSMHISYDGTITPCVYLGESFVDGNIHTARIRDVWKNGKNFIKIRNLKLNDECKQCERKMICHGECPAVRMISTNKLNGIDPACIKRFKKAG